MCRIPCLPALSAALFVAGFAGAVHATEAIVLQATQIKALGIETVTVGQPSDLRQGTYPARVMVPNAQLRVVAAPVAGLVEMLVAAPGESVRKGQVLARLASTQALELQRDAVQAGSQAALLQQNLKRDEQLFAEGLIAESRLQATRAAATQANALAGERRQGLALAGAAAGKMGGFLELTATIDGVVLEQAVQLGQRVEAATLVYRIAQLSPLWLEIQAPVDFSATLKTGMAVKVADSGVSGKLIGIGRAVDAASQTVLLRAEVVGGAESLRPGQVVAVEITGGEQRGQTLPASAVIRNNGQPLAFVQITGGDTAMRFEARPVQVIAQSGERVIVTGVKAGEQVASQGVSGLKAILAGVGSE
jgi:RND family efflux transporter MFP subunit